MSEKKAAPVRHDSRKRRRTNRAARPLPPPGADEGLNSGTDFSPGSEAQESPANAGDDKKHRPQVRYKIRELPPEIRGELDQKLKDGNFGGYRELSKWLRERSGNDISPSALNYYHRHRFERRLEAVSHAMVQAQAIARVTGPDQDKLAFVTATVAQTLLLEMLIARQELEEARQAARRAHERGDLRIDKREARKNAEAKTDEPGAEEGTAAEGGAERRAERKYPVKADFELMQCATRAMEAIMDYRNSIENGPWKGKKRGAKVKPADQASDSSREGGLSVQAEASIRAALLDTP